MKLWKKLVICATSAFAIYFLLSYISEHYSSQWARLTAISSDNSNGRYVLWSNSIELWRRSFLWGNGLGSLYRYFGKANHSMYFELLTDLGLIGFASFICIFIKMAKKAYYFDIGLFIAFVGLLSQFIFLNALDNRVFWVFLCWLAMLPRKRIQRQATLKDDYH